MDGGTSRAAGHELAKSWTRLSMHATQQHKNPILSFYSSKILMALHLYLSL